MTLYLGFHTAPGCGMEGPSYLCPKTGPHEGSTAGSAAPAAHGGPDCHVQLAVGQQSMQRPLEGVRQNCKTSPVTRDIHTTHSN